MRPKNKDPYRNNSQEIRSGVPAARSTNNGDLGFQIAQKNGEREGEKLTCFERTQIHGTCNKSRYGVGIRRPRIHQEHRGEEEEEVELTGGVDGERQEEEEREAAGGKIYRR